MIHLEVEVKQGGELRHNIWEVEIDPGGDSGRLEALHAVHQLR